MSCGSSIRVTPKGQSSQLSPCGPDLWVVLQPPVEGQQHLQLQLGGLLAGGGGGAAVEHGEQGAQRLGHPGEAPRGGRTQLGTPGETEEEEEEGRGEYSEG